jgi:hypothetical protein
MRIWKDIPGFEELYQVSNDGKVRSLTELTPDVSSHGYARVTIYRGEYKKKERHRFGVHQLVLLAFNGAPPENLEINHKDGKPENNNLENLEYVTRRYNQWHCNNVIKTREPQKGSKHGMSKLTEEIVLKIRAEHIAGANYSTLSRRYNTSVPSISMIVNRKTWRHI